MKKLRYRLLRWWYKKHLVNIKLDIGTPPLGVIFGSKTDSYTIKHYGNNKYLIFTSKTSKVNAKIKEGKVLMIDHKK